MKATDVLKKQHKAVKALFNDVLEAEDAESRRQLCGQIADELKIHSTIEEQIFYPAVRDLGEKGEEIVLESLEEHHVVDLVLAELPRVNPRDDRFKAKMTVLSELVDHHVKEEERDMFKRAQALGVKRLTELGEQLVKAAARYQGSAESRA